MMEVDIFSSGFSIFHFAICLFKFSVTPLFFFNCVFLHLFGQTENIHTVCQYTEDVPCPSAGALEKVQRSGLGVRGQLIGHFINSLLCLIIRGLKQAA